MKTLVVTMSDKIVEEYTRFTLPIIKAYAKKIGAGFRILKDDGNPEYKGRGMWNFRTMIFNKWLKAFDRIMYIDSDTLINRDCSNIFEVVPEDTIGFVLEDKGSRKKDRLERIKIIKRAFGGNERWKTGFLNGGFYVVSKCHRQVFTKINGKLWNGTGFDGNHYMYNVMKQRHKFIDLGFKWNHMSMFSEPWNGSPSRFDSYIIHYAGAGGFPDKGERHRTKLMCDDIKRVYGELKCL